MPLIKKAELIERLKAGATLKRYEAMRGNSPHRYYLVGGDGGRVNARAVNILFKENRLKQTKRDFLTAEYVWKGE